MALRGRGSFNVEVNLSGNWVMFNNIVDNTNILLAIAAREGQRQFAEEYRDNVKGNIATGGKRFGYPPNSPGYIRWKLDRGGPSTVLNWSRAFYGSVEVRENTTGSRFMVGIPKGERRPYYHRNDKNRLTIAEYANVLEHGTDKIPARPVFSDTFSKQMMGKRGLKKYIELNIIKRFGSLGVRVNKI